MQNLNLSAGNARIMMMVMEGFYLSGCLKSLFLSGITNFAQH